MEPIEVKNFIQKMLADLNEAVNTAGTTIIGDIDVDLTIQKVVSAGGDLKIYVLSGGAKTGQENVSKVHFKLKPKDSDYHI